MLKDRVLGFCSGHSALCPTALKGTDLLPLIETQERESVTSALQKV